MGNKKTDNQEDTGFAQRRPYIFSFLILLLVLFVIRLEPIVDQLTNLPSNLSYVLVETVLAAILAGIVSAMHWWKKIGFRWFKRPKILWIYAPAFALFIIDLIIQLMKGGIHIPPWTTFWVVALYVVALGFVEEVTFRGLMLRAMLPRGEWTAVLVAAGLFGLSHFGNLLVGLSLTQTLLQVAYALAIGFGFGAMAIRGRLIWPLIIAHALVDFISMGNLDVNIYFIIKSVIFVVLYTSYGIYLLRKENLAPHSGRPKNQ